MSFDYTKTILSDIKSMLSVEYGDSFDKEILLFINSAVMEVYQLGCCTYQNEVTEDTTWGDILSTDDMKMSVSFLDFINNLIKTPSLLITTILFDPPTSGFYTTALEKELDELKYRLIVQVEGTLTESEYIDKAGEPFIYDNE